MNPADLTIGEAGAQLRRGALTSTALTEAHLDRRSAATVISELVAHVPVP